MLDGECLWFGNRCCRRNGLVELSPEGLGGQAIPLFARESHGATPAAIGIGLCQGLCARPEDELITRSGISRAGHIRWHPRKCWHGLIELLDQRDFMQCPLRRRRLCNAWPAKSDLDAIWQLARGKRCRGRAPGLADRIRATAAQKREQRDQCQQGNQRTRLLPKHGCLFFLVALSTGMRQQSSFSSRDVSREQFVPI